MFTKKFRTLNKLTLENFTKLGQNLQNQFAQIGDPETYKECVATVFDKAVSEPNFSKVYVELCKNLNEVQPAYAKEQQQPKIGLFRKELLEHCQNEFQNVVLHQNSETLPDEPEERLIVEEKLRRRRLGNIRLIGEMFKNKLLAAKIVHMCIQSLFDDITHNKDRNLAVAETSCELLARLMQTTGKLLDIPEAANWMNTYFKHITTFSENQQFSLRVRFLFLDLIELRGSNWVPRRIENVPKTISEVHDEALIKDLEDRLFADEVHSMNANPVAPTNVTKPTPTTTNTSTLSKTKKANPPHKKQQPQKKPNPDPPEDNTIRFRNCKK